MCTAEHCVALCDGYGCSRRKVLGVVILNVNELPRIIFPDLLSLSKGQIDSERGSISLEYCSIDEVEGRKIPES